jgi:cyclic pyranopterin monophosphate synthase
MVRQRPIEGKPITFRQAEAVGDLKLRAATRRVIRAGRIEKGDPIAAAEIAGLSAMKRTSELLPHCHIVPLTGSSVEVTLTRTGVRALVRAESLHRTGVEMEALVGTTISLLTVWDMVKYLEKDASGNYPATSLGPVRVRRKTKTPLGTPE